ncbi:Superfamily I DNA and RNA helicase and helicase subunit [Rubellimicrobium mesophilum DSM 19309]|uniref:Superfamily I DNA and RNA helicase and helicase subunit n=1 Tax=Rubellimicrobium mesophilum DSM 19309 TaxID=442562 RepID=A0A017HIV2_9RHOB|nr:Superfamily I DNA and RNA helicase and helicase subunit [Rubellimicrobium mesophilum DSM 19309]
MKTFGDTILLSASDVMRFAGCQHATAHDLRWMRREPPKPREAGAEAVILQGKGDAHEAGHLDKLRADGRRIIGIEGNDLVRDVGATLAALREGPEVIYQGALMARGEGAAWGGWSDFLERVDRPSKLGEYSYEVVDTKLKRSVTAKHVLQLALYSDLLAEVQGVHPEHIHVELGTGKRATLRLVEFAAYARRLRRRLQGFVASPWATRAAPCADCDLCRWGDACDDQWRAEDSLFGVANISKVQVAKLEAAGVRTMAELASLDRVVRGLSPSTQGKLVLQAKLQHDRKTGEPTHVLREPEPGRGYALLPRRDPGDIFYDIEGDPHVDGGGLEYLHGLWCGGEFHALWSHDRAGEKEALRKLLGFFEARLRESPEAHIYHYAAYEVTALKRLTVRHGIGEALLDRLLRERRFVDLYTVVRGAVVASEDNYSIKSLEALYGLERDGEVKTAGGSVVAYERYRDTGDEAILKEIEAYNRVDCVSTEKLRDWLVTVRPAGEWPVLGQGSADAEESDSARKDREHEEEVRRLLGEPGEDKVRRALLDLGLFHRREAKPAWWAVLASVDKQPEELEEDLDALGGLEAMGPAEPTSTRKSVQRRYRFPPQETKIRAGQTVSVPTDGFPDTVEVVELDHARGEVLLKKGNAKAHLLADRLSLHPTGPLKTDVIRDGLRAVIVDQCGEKRLTAVDDLLARRPPRLRGGPVADILGGRDPVEGTVDAVLRMEGTVLPIQGPPGTGKTYVTARAILALVREGKRVGVAASSHEAIRNVLLGCLSALEEADLPFDCEIAHKVGEGEDSYEEGCPIQRPTSNDAAILSAAPVVGGTAWFFARDEQAGRFDYLFVDEAGQMGLANLLGMGRAARNIVLVGDPRQLPQVIQGSHPDPAGLSCLEWLLGEASTIPPDRGIFLPVSRRMHPDACPLHLGPGLCGPAPEPPRHRQTEGWQHPLPGGRRLLGACGAQRPRPDLPRGGRGHRRGRGSAPLRALDRQGRR